MNIQDYCSNVDMELTSWNAKLNDVMHKVDQFPTGKKERMFEEVNGLRIIMTELETRIDQLRTECPLSWKPEQESIERRLSDLSERYQDASVEFFDYEFGG